MDSNTAVGVAVSLSTKTRSRQHWWARSFTGLRPISVMASPPTVTLPTSVTTSNINGSNNAASLPTAGKIANLNSTGYASSLSSTSNPNNPHLRAYGPANTDASLPTATLTRVRFTLLVPQFEVVFVENAGSRINAMVDGSLVTAGGVGVIPNPLQSSGTRYMKFDFGADTTSYGVVGGTANAVGSGYAQGDTVTLSGGTSTRAATYRVGFVNTGAVGNLYLQDPGDYSVLPTYPAATTTSGSGTGCTVTPPFYFPRHTTLKPREIELQVEGAWLYGINYTAPASGEPAITPYAFNPRVPSLYWVDDSQGANTYGTYAGGDIGYLVALRLGLVDNFTTDARGGTGFSVVSGTAPAFEHANRTAAIIAAQPDFIFVPFSQNVGTQTATTNAAIAWVQAVQAGCPNAKIVVCGPAQGHQTWHATAIAAMLAAAPIPANIRSIDSISEGWDTGGAAGFLTSDGTHWGMYGNLEWRSKLLAQHVANALLSMIP